MTAAPDPADVSSHRPVYTQDADPASAPDVPSSAPIPAPVANPAKVRPAPDQLEREAAAQQQQ